MEKDKRETAQNRPDIRRRRSELCAQFDALDVVDNTYNGLWLTVQIQHAVKQFP